MAFLSPSTATVPLRTLLSGRGNAVRFTVADVQRMLEMGVIPEDAGTELLRGVIVYKDRADQGDAPHVIGTNHRRVVTLLTALAVRINSDRQHVQIQNPVICSDLDAPEPDFAIVLGAAETFPNRLPTAADVTCVVEVADSSLERDVEDKGPIYASAGVPRYLVIDLQNGVVLVHEQVNRQSALYERQHIVGPEGNFSLLLADQVEFSVPVRSLLR